METDYSPSPSGESENNQNNQWKMFAIGGVLSWCLLIICSWLTFWEPDVRFSLDGTQNYKNKGIYFWLYPAIATGKGLFYAVYIFYLFFFPILILSIIIFCVGFAVYIYCLFIKKDIYVINAMFGQFTKFHFVPFLCASLCFIISECIDDDIGKVIDPSNFQIIMTIITTFIGLCSIAFIYFQTKLEYPIYAKLTINRGTYSCLLALFSFGFFFNIFYYGYKNRLKKDSLKDWVKGCNYAFSIILGALNLGLSVFFKDIVLAGINCLMYIGMAINFFLIDDNIIKIAFDDEYIVGIIDIVVALASAGLAVFLFIKYNPFIQNNNE